MSTATATRTVLDAFDEVFARHFAGPSWDAWRAFLAALYGLPMSEAQAECYRACTGRQTLPTRPAREAWMVIGRRGGKSRVAAFLAVWAACFVAYPRLAPGEVPVVMVLAADRRQAKVVFRYIDGLLRSVPWLDALVVARTAEAITLSTGVVIAVHTASYRAVRGYTVVTALCDEVAFWETGEDAANPDKHILDALRPAMATIPGALLIALSSPYARKGELWRAFERHYGQDGAPVLVWQAPSRTMNPELPQAVVDAALEEDEAAARAEYLAEFRRDVETFLSPDTVRAVVSPDRTELPPQRCVAYRAFVDPAGGSGQDSMTCAIAHGERRGEHDVAVLDLVREVRPPFAPSAVVQDFAERLRAYRVPIVRGDRYAGSWPAEQFQRHGIRYEPSERPKADLYRDCLPLITSGQVELLDHPRLLKQLTSLERRTGPSGRDLIDHPPRSHDDVANAAAGALLEALRAKRAGGQVSRLTGW